MKHPDQPAGGSYWLIILTLAIGTLIITLDLGAMNIGLSAIMKDLNVPLSVATWAETGYVIVVASLYIIIGQAGDRQGLNRTYMRGMMLFTLASLLCGVSWDIFSLVGQG